MLAPKSPYVSNSLLDYTLGIRQRIRKMANRADSAPVVYIGMASDLIHEGHINIIKTGRGLGSVCVGLLTDDAIRTYKRQPILSYESRKVVIENIRGVDRVIPQHEHDYRPNLELIRPAFVVHGDDWRTGPQARVRQVVIDKLGEWGGRLIEPEYTSGISTSEIIERCSAECDKERRRGRILVKSPSLASSPAFAITAIGDLDNI